MITSMLIFPLISSKIYTNFNSINNSINFYNFSFISRYFKFEGLGSKDQWFAMLQEFLINKIETPSPTFESLADDFDGDVLPLDQQFEVVSSLPNYHPWITSNSGVKMHNYFHPTGKSPRNVVLGEINNMNDTSSEEHFILIKDIIKLIVKRTYKIVKIPKITTRKVSNKSSSVYYFSNSLYINY